MIENFEKNSGFNTYDVLLVSAGVGAVIIASFAAYSYFIQTDDHDHILDHGGLINPGSTIHGHVEENLGSPTETIIIVDDHVHKETTQPVPAPVATASPNQAVDSHYADGHTHNEVVIVAPQPQPVPIPQPQPQPVPAPVAAPETIPPTIAPPTVAITAPAG